MWKKSCLIVPVLLPELKKRSESESYSATIVWNNPVYKINISDPKWTGSLLSFEDKNTYRSL